MLDHFPDHYIQTFDDKAKDKSLTTHGPPSKYPEGELHRLNELGAGIFFTPNRFTKARKKDLCEGVNAWIVEMDDVSKPEQWDRIMKAPINPSIVVETRSSYHCYWLAEDGTIENYDRIVRGLIEHFGGDPACKDISRVFRIPGYYHHKENPYLVEIKHCENRKQKEETMMKWFPYREPEIEIRPPEIKTEGLDFWDHVSRLDNKLMLQRLSGRPVANFETITFRPRTTGGEYIDVNGKSSDAWLDENGMIGSGKGGGPTFVQWLTFYGWSKGEIAKWIKEECSDLIPAAVIKPQKAVIESSDVKANNLDMSGILNDKSNLTWGNSVLDDSFSPLECGRYVILVGETGVGKTAWAFHFAKRNAEKGNKVLYLSLEMSNEGLLARYARNRMNLSKKQWRDRNFDHDEFRRHVESVPDTLVFKKIKKKNGEIDLGFVGEVIRGGYDMVFIDNFGFIEAEGESTHDQMKNISREIVSLKNETNTTVIALHHFRKGGEKTVKLRNLDAILGSGKIGHDVDFAIQVLRDMEVHEDAFDHEKAKLSVVMMKDRDFGDLSMQNVYYKNGEFNSIFHD